MSELPKEQDTLLKQLQHFEALEKQGIIPERSNTNLFLIIFTWIVCTILTAIFAFRKETALISPILILCFLITSTLYGAYNNKMWGFYTSTIVILAACLYATYVNGMHYTDLITLLDGIVIFVFANQFAQKGYAIAAFIIAGKVLIIHFLFDSQKDIEDVTAILINTLTIGFTPVLMTLLSKASRRAKIQELRSEILSLQNQELLQSWGNYYKTRPATDPGIPNQTTTQTEPSEYQSPYETTEESKDTVQDKERH